MTKNKPNWLNRMLGVRGGKQPSKQPVVSHPRQQCMTTGLDLPVNLCLRATGRPGQILLDEFVVEGLLGEGGMGTVYLVRSRTSGLAFAVKRAKALGDVTRRNFLAELQTWIGLPEHPNLVACRFFRTVGDEVLIFAEYVEGGSLSEWIRSRKLYEGGTRAALERMLGVAIQSAWGLHCLHELGLVHQDVKPGNVLMAGEGRAAVHGVHAKVTDFGLARAKAAGGEGNIPGLGQSILVSSGGRTPAYCSPEQAKGLAVTRKTDIWSWGVSVLEMFTGDVTWTSGQLAADVLEGYLREPQNQGVIPAMPGWRGGGAKEGVSNSTRRIDGGACRRSWTSLRRLLSEDRGIPSTAKPYLQSSEAPRRKWGIMERRDFAGSSWVDPRELLEQVLRAEGRDPAEAEAIASKRAGSRRGDLVADLAIYDEARRVYERLLKGGRKGLDPTIWPSFVSTRLSCMRWPATDLVHWGSTTGRLRSGTG